MIIFGPFIYTTVDEARFRRIIFELLNGSRLHLNVVNWLRDTWMALIYVDFHPDLYWYSMRKGVGYGDANSVDETK